MSNLPIRRRPFESRADYIDRVTRLRDHYRDVLARNGRDFELPPYDMRGFTAGLEAMNAWLDSGAPLL